ncbi:MAG: hypothetical protein LAT67_04130 [Balneolales bacterium]|nr:hypothetical protein [Balneolales bacterium]
MEKRKKTKSVIERLLLALEARLLPNSLYLKKQFKIKTGKVLNLKSPRSFSEKIQWLKLHNTNPLLTQIADKFEVKKYVERNVSEKYIIPTHSLYTSANQIKLSRLPEKFALKATHGSGWNQIHLNHDHINEKQIQEYFKKWLNKSYYTYSKEWAYKNIPPRVICEELFLREDNSFPEDFKIFCFSGKAKYIQVDHNRFGNHTRSIYSENWQKMPFSIGKKIHNQKVKPPLMLKEMIEISEKLSSPFPFIRIDLFNVGEVVKVGELTCYPGNGMERFSDPEWDLKLGDLLSLPSKL